MKTPEDEAFDDLARKQGAWGGGFKAKQAMAANKLQEPWNEDEWRRNNWRCSHGWLRGEQCESCNAAQEPDWKEQYEYQKRRAEMWIAKYEKDIGPLEKAQPAQESYDQTALELCNVCGWKTLIPDDCCLNCERAQPAQEPLAWMCSAFDGEPCEQTNHDECGNPIPLYTTPPQRPWVGLTVEDFSAIKFPAEMLFPPEFRAGARWAEAKLKEKNT